MRIVLAIFLAVIASGCFALGATAQHLGVERNFAAEGGAADDRALTLRRLLKLLVTPMWIGGLALIGVGAALHVVGLSMAPLAVIQPVGILAVPFSILLANRIYHTHTTGKMWASVALTVAGIVAFTYASAQSTGAGEAPTWHGLLVSSGVIWGVSIVLALLAWRARGILSCLWWALAGACLYGLGSAYIKVLTMEFHHGLTGTTFLVSAALLLAAYAAGGWMIQQGYASGPAPIVVGCMTTLDPIVAVLFGLFVLREARAVHPLFDLAMLAGAIAAIVGVFLLSKYHPEARQRTGEGSVVDSGAHVERKGEIA